MTSMIKTNVFFDFTDFSVEPVGRGKGTNQIGGGVAREGRGIRPNPGTARGFQTVRQGGRRRRRGHVGRRGGHV